MNSADVVLNTRFGRLHANRQATLEMVSPLHGFEGLVHFTLLKFPEYNPVLWFQSLEQAGLAFPVVEPDSYFSNYSQLVCQTTGCESTVLCMVSRQDGVLGLNLLAPILIDSDKATAKQVLLNRPGLNVFHPLGAPNPC